MISDLKRLLTNYHFLIILILFGALAFFYSDWPWVKANYPFRELVSLALFEHKTLLMGSLLVTPIVYAAIVFSWQVATVLVSMAVLFMLPKMLEFHFNPAETIVNISLIIFPALTVILFKLELARRAKERRMLVERAEEHQRYIADVLSAQENERKRISQELHDGVTQDLLVIASSIQPILNEININTSVKKQMKEMVQYLLKVSEDVRAISVSLRPGVLDTVGLVPAIKWLANHIFTATDIKTEILIKGQKRKLAPEIEAHIFRIAQEALNNIRFHSAADKAEISIYFGTQYFKLQIRDNGKGFNVPAAIRGSTYKKRLGLTGMHQRAQLLHGRLNVESELGKGTAVSFELSI